MSGVTLSVRMFGGAEAEQQLGALVDAVDDLSEFADALGLVFEGNVIDRFDREVDVDGRPLIPSIRKKEEGGKTLTDSGRYRGSITSQATAQRILLGTNVIYAAPNHFGATIRAKGDGKLKFKLPGGLGFRSAEEVTLPARPVIGIGPEDRSDAAVLFEDFFAAKAPDLFIGGTA